MNGIFNSLSLSETSSPESLNNASPTTSDRPHLNRTTSTKSTAQSTRTEEGQVEVPFDLDIMETHDRNLYAETADFQWL